MAGLEKLKTELKDLVDACPGIRKAIQTAREQGDLRENAEYHAARETLGVTEARINALRATISSAEMWMPLK